MKRSSSTKTYNITRKTRDNPNYYHEINTNDNLYYGQNITFRSFAILKICIFNFNHIWRHPNLSELTPIINSLRLGDLHLEPEYYFQLVSARYSNDLYLTHLNLIAIKID